MNFIKVYIVKFIDNCQPGVIECMFKDSWGREHIIQEKVPIVSNNCFDEYTIYPQVGELACEILREWTDKDFRKILSVTIENRIQLKLFME